MSDKAVNSVRINVDAIDICQDDNHAGHAFPTDHHEGMTLLDYFAAKAMQGLLANPEWRSLPVADAAAWAYEQAEAMLAERENRNG